MKMNLLYIYVRTTTKYRGARSVDDYNQKIEEQIVCAVWLEIERTIVNKLCIMMMMRLAFCSLLIITCTKIKNHGS